MLVWCSPPVYRGIPNRWKNPGNIDGVAVSSSSIVVPIMKLSIVSVAIPLQAMHLERPPHNADRASTRPFLQQVQYSKGGETSFWETSGLVLSRTPQCHVKLEQRQMIKYATWLLYACLGARASTDEVPSLERCSPPPASDTNTPHRKWVFVLLPRSLQVITSRIIHQPPGHCQGFCLMTGTDDSGKPDRHASTSANHHEVMAILLPAIPELLLW